MRHVLPHPVIRLLIGAALFIAGKELRAELLRQPASIRPHASVKFQAVPTGRRALVAQHVSSRGEKTSTPSLALAIASRSTQPLLHSLPAVEPAGFVILGAVRLPLGPPALPLAADPGAPGPPIANPQRLLPTLQLTSD